MMRTLLVFLSVGVLAGCVSSPPSFEANGAAGISPVQAVVGAAEHPNGIPGDFKFVVQGTGERDGWLYLNSESDYRDQRCLTVAVSTRAARQLEQRVGPNVSNALFGKTIVVHGSAKRVRVVFVVGDRVSDKYYYQTQVEVMDAANIRIL
jgi:hypothetical protein